MKMKFQLAIAFFLIVLMHNGAFSQNKEVIPREDSNELGINIDNIFAESNSNYLGSWNPSGRTKAVGLSYKRIYSKSAFRSRISYSSVNNFVDDSLKNTTKDNYLLLAVQAGYELRKKVGSVQLLYGLDVMLNSYIYSQDYVSSSQPSSLYDKVRTEVWGVGLVPFLGMKYYILPNFSVSTEINLTINSYRGKYRHYSNNISDRNDKVAGCSVFLGPIGSLGINFSF